MKPLTIHIFIAICGCENGEIWYFKSAVHDDPFHAFLYKETGFISEYVSFINCSNFCMCSDEGVCYQPMNIKEFHADFIPYCKGMNSKSRQELILSKNNERALERFDFDIQGVRAYTDD